MNDQAKIFVSSGKGGDGLVAFRREKYVPHGGPAGGDGGKGADVILRVNPKINTLIAFTRQIHFKGNPGVRGGTSTKTGKSARDVIIEVPAGTIVRDAETGEILADLVRPEDSVIVAKGGRGGRGNARFATSNAQAPRYAEKGEPGEERWITLELRLIADVGIVGVPNAGKSTLLSVISNARPKIADYPFTTLEPQLGVVLYDSRDLVVADIPGLLEGAHSGVGLGHSFLRHVTRTRVLVHLLDGAAEDPLADFNQINVELSLYDDKLGKRPQIVVFSKMDLPEAQEHWPAVRKALRARGIEPMAISAATRQDVNQLIQRMFTVIDELPVEPDIIETMPLYELSEEELPFEIEHVSAGTYRVIGKRIERAAKMTYWDYEEAVLRFQRTLDILGITSALREAGVQEGDSVFIGDHELEWSD
ncbi:MAG: GTPase ObgE [Anaerolineae bacterium]|nr:GTPase ObgE [Anaerolineae bacterium]